MFRRDELERFFRAADAQLTATAEVTVVGGTAVALLAGGAPATRDIDVTSASEELQTAFQVARATTGLNIPVAPVGVYSAPYSFEERLLQVTIPGLRHLRVRVPERHDLAIMKVARGYQHDLDAIELLHRERALDLDVLLVRLRETEMIGSRGALRESFRAVVGRLFGDDVAGELDLSTS